EDQDEGTDRRQDDGRCEGEGDGDLFRVQDFTTLVREFVVNPLPPFIDALDESRGLELLQLLEQRRLAELQQVAQVRHRLAARIYSRQNIHAHGGGEGPRAFRLSGDLWSPCSHVMVRVRTEP